ncbi:hypothetical protein KQH50_01540 [bacterium]|nr:hypothetical protein [bacterium]
MPSGKPSTPALRRSLLHQDIDQRVIFEMSISFADPGADHSLTRTGINPAGTVSPLTANITHRSRFSGNRWTMR